MIILQDSQIKKIFHNGDEVKKILDWDGNVIFYKQSGGGGMTNYIKFTTSPSVASENNVQVTYADSTQDTVSYSEPSKEYTLSIPTDKIVNKIDFDNTMVDEVKVSCKVNLSKTFFTNKPKTIRILNCDATSSTSFYYLFSGSTNVETIEMKDSDFSNVTDMVGMFYKCSGATTIDIANCNTSNVTNMSQMFNSCEKLTSLDLSGFDTSNVTDMSFMFPFCSNLTSLDLNGWDTSNVTNMTWMFVFCSNLTSLDLSGFDTSNVTNTGYMFYFCTNLTSLDLSGWDLTKITNLNNMSNMFSRCDELKTIRMIGCNQTTIDKIKKALTSAGILNKVAIVT